MKNIPIMQYPVNWKKYYSWLVGSFTLTLLMLSSSIQAVVFHPTISDHQRSYSSSDPDLSGVGYFQTYSLGGRIGICTAQPIAPQVLITAAHCTNSNTVATGTFRFDVDNDTVYEGSRSITRFIDHPGWSNDGRRSRSILEYANDIALVFLDRPLPSSVKIYKIASYSFLPHGLAVYLGGYGVQGVVGNAVSNRSVLRGFDKQHATNVIDSSLYGKVLRTNMTNKPYTRFSGSVDGDAFYEGQIASGDSGGGVFTSAAFDVSYYRNRYVGITIKLLPSELELVAINSHGKDNNNPYGSEAGYVFLSPHIPWIESNMGNASVTLSSSTGPKQPMARAPFYEQSMSAEVPDLSVADIGQWQDGFPNVHFISLDSDGDGFPDQWDTEGLTSDIQEYQGYYLDYFPDDSRYARDQDQDNLADEWEMQHFSSLQVAAGDTDVDEDGSSDVEEFLSQTNPNAALGATWDSLETDISVVGRLNAGVTRRFKIENAREVYSISRSGDLDFYVYSAEPSESDAAVCLAINFVALDECVLDPQQEYWIELVVFADAGAEGAEYEFRAISENANPKKVINGNEWSMISFPLGRDQFHTVADYATSGISSSTYGQDWVLFDYSYADNGYFQHTYEHPLTGGKGYWLLQLNDYPVVLHGPKADYSGADAPESRFVTQETDVSWSLFGYPLTVSTERDENIVEYPVLGCANGCTPQDASELAGLAPVWWGYSSTLQRYTAIDATTTLNPWDAYWLGAARPEDGQDFKTIKVSYPR